jgi:hypothetical protein
MTSPIFHKFDRYCQKLRINSKEFGIVPLKFWGTQREYLQQIQKGVEEGVRDFKCLKGRQGGITTVDMAIAVFWLNKYAGSLGAMITDDASNLNRGRSILTQYMKSLGPGYHVGHEYFGHHNIYELELDNASILSYLVAGKRKKSGDSGDLGQGKGLNFLIATECASWSDSKQVDKLTDSLAERHPNRLYLWESPLALDTPIPVPGGWSAIEEIRKGDLVFDERGRQCRVVGASPVFQKRRCYRITFSNGDSIISDECHKWQVVERRWPTNPQWKIKILTTKELCPEKHRIEIAKPLETSETKLPIDPYFLGVWLGDGKSSDASITTSDEDVEELRKILILKGNKVGTIRKYGWRVPCFTVHGQRGALVRLGLLNNKHIPPIYLRASERQRRELLAGLMDTDGHVDKKTFRCEFSNTSARLISDVAELLSSLGIKFTRSVFWAEGKKRTFPSGKTYACSQAERLRFSENPKLKVFNLSRKSRDHKAKRGRLGYTPRKTKYLQIVSIEACKSVPVKCLQVDSHSHLFLVGRTMIPTHNTANGFNHWYDMCRDAKDAVTQRFIFIGWWLHELHWCEKGSKEFRVYWDGKLTTEEKQWVREVKALYDFEIKPEQIAWWRLQLHEKKRGELNALYQEHPPTEEYAFVMSGYKYFSSDRLTDAYKKAKEQKTDFYRYTFGKDFMDLRVHDTNNVNATLFVWEKPSPFGEYVFGADPAFGYNPESDESVISIYRCYSDRLVQVAEFCGTGIRTDQMAWILLHLGGWYKNVMVNLEITGPGGSVMAEMKHVQTMQRLLASRGQANFADTQSCMKSFLYSRQDSLVQSFNYHTKTNHDEKEQMLGAMKGLFETEKIDIRSLGLLNEMKYFCRSGGSLEGLGGEYDDRVIATALAIIAFVRWVRPRLAKQGQTYESVQKQEVESPDEARGFAINFLASRGIVLKK